MGFEETAALSDEIFDLVKGVDETIGQDFVDGLPEVFGRLKFGAVGRLKDEMDSLRDINLLTGMPTCLVKNENDLLTSTSPGRFSKERESQAESDHIDGWDQVQLCASCLGVDESVDIQPQITSTLNEDRALTDRRPDSAHDGFGANTVLILSPKFDLILWMSLLDLLNLLGELIF